MIVDIDILVLGNLYINGHLTFDDSKDVTLRAKNIWIPKGNFTAGTA